MHALTRVLDLLFPPRPTERTVRTADEEALAALLSPSSVPLPDRTVATALFPFNHPLVHALVVEAKYYGNRRAHALLGSALADYLKEHEGEESAFFRGKRFLVPVPLSPARKSVRGYNQAEEACRAALPFLGTDWSLAAHALSRTRTTRPQTNLSRRERFENVQGAFAAHGVEPGALYVVVDDVVTTGATLAAACGALRTAGATTVVPLAVSSQENSYSRAGFPEYAGSALDSARTS